MIYNQISVVTYTRPMHPTHFLPINQAVDTADSAAADPGREVRDIWTASTRTTTISQRISSIPSYGACICPCYLRILQFSVPQNAQITQKLTSSASVNRHNDKAWNFLHLLYLSYYESKAKYEDNTGNHHTLDTTREDLYIA